MSASLRKLTAVVKEHTAAVNFMRDADLSEASRVRSSIEHQNKTTTTTTLTCNEPVKRLRSAILMNHYSKDLLAQCGTGDLRLALTLTLLKQRPFGRTMEQCR